MAACADFFCAAVVALFSVSSRACSFARLLDAALSTDCAARANSPAPAVAAAKLTVIAPMPAAIPLASGISAGDSASAVPPSDG